SATAEDLPDASFAGQQETYLNIVGAQQVVEACRRCWSSLWTGRALSYRVKNAIAPGDVALAVVVQRLVAAEVAGVLFTANPVSGRRDQMVIDGAWGLGEAVVSGIVTPDHWVADGTTGATLERQVSAKAVMTVRTAGGTETVSVPADLQEQPVLNAEQVADLVRLGREAAAYFKAPQDLEWAVAGGQLYLLQSRPITTLFPLPEPAPPPEAGLRLYVFAGAFQGVMEPITPAGIDAVRTGLYAVPRTLGLNVAPNWFTVAAMRPYPDLTGVVRSGPFGGKLEGNLLDSATQRALQDLVDREPRLQPAASGGGGLPVRQIRKGLLLTVLGRVLAAAVNPAGARRRVLEGLEAYMRSLEEQSRSLTAVPERVAFVRRALESMCSAIILRTVPLAGPSMAMRAVAERKLKAWGIDTALLEQVGRSVPHNPTTEMGLALWRTAQALKREGQPPRAGHPAMAAFLAQYGHRAIREVDLGMPRWREEPEPVLQMLATYMEQDASLTDPERQFSTGAAAAEKAVDELAAQVRRRQGVMRAALLRFMLRRFRQLSGAREWHKFYLIRMMAIARPVLLEVGAELTTAGRVAQPDDVFFLEFAEMESQQDLRSIVDRRRAEYQRELKRRVLPLAMTSEGEISYGARPASGSVLAGTGASGGVYEGVVRIILDPAGAKLEPGEILVAPGTDPAWTPLFLTAGALITETGGMVSHGSVVAREYGIPAVVGVPEATTRLSTGQRVRVDGSSGLVVPLD
ncbi:MAG TPA: PEP/pyruvate-binding domain-containing protein, partial [Symbiobacteriaceae bacterium]|nr:PEP/pyruvate-binding domain-containing protein [Symbiobacteriaceae bacterium]